MGIKTLFSVAFVFVAIGLLLGYYFYFFSNNELEFSSNPKNYNFNLDSSYEGIQFYANMRYPNKEIKYRVFNCEHKKAQDMKDAFDFIENLTILDFQEVESGEEIYVTCSEETRFEKNMFVAGEAGPTRIIRSGLYSIIQSGEILLIRDSQCEKPNVAIHELLHALGFKHSENPNSIMYNVSSCKQTVGEQIPMIINALYSIESLPDLVFENVSATMSGRYLNLNLSVRNAGIGNSSEAVIKVINKENVLKEIKLDELEFGSGRIISFTNIFIAQLTLDEINIYIDSMDKELDKENNYVVLEVKQ